jgi:integrase
MVPIYADMIGFLEMARSSNPPGCPWVIQVDGKRVDSIKTAWAAAFERAGLVADTGRKRKSGEALVKPIALFHDLRRTAATMLHEAGYDLPAIMDICGWRSVAMPKRYIQQSVKQVQRIGERMTEFMRGQMAAAAARTEKEQLQ